MFPLSGEGCLDQVRATVGTPHLTMETDLVSETLCILKQITKVMDNVQINGWTYKKQYCAQYDNYTDLLFFINSYVYGKYGSK